MVEPEPGVAGPLFDYVKYVFSNADLEEMFNKLLSATINIDTKDDVHPAFVPLLCQLSTYDANILNILYHENLFNFPYVDFEIEYYFGEENNSVNSEVYKLTFLNTVRGMSPYKTQKSIQYLISLGLLKLTLKKRFSNLEYIENIKYHFLKCRSGSDFNLSAHPCINRYIVEKAKNLEENKNYTIDFFDEDGFRPEFRILDSEKGEWRYPDSYNYYIEINDYLEKILNNIEVKYKTHDIVIRPQRGRLELTDLGRDLMRYCARKK